MNVFQYFQTQISSNRLDDCGEENDGWSNIPLDSPCGEDCKSAIDAAHTMIESVRKAFGEDSSCETDLIDMTIEVLNCFIFG